MVKCKSLRPNVESFVVYGEHTEQNLLDGPFRSIVTENVLVVSQVTGQRMVLHQLVLHLLPQPPPFPFPSATPPFVLHQIRIFSPHLSAAKTTINLKQTQLNALRDLQDERKYRLLRKT